MINRRSGIEPLTVQTWGLPKFSDWLEENYDIFKPGVSNGMEIIARAFIRYVDEVIKPHEPRRINCMTIHKDRLYVAADTSVYFYDEKSGAMHPIEFVDSVQKQGDE